jgi:GNAT superfamily N-acetyltransferase
MPSRKTALEHPRTVRRATPGDRAGVVGTVAAAFARDPAWRFLLGAGADYARLAPELAGALFDLRVDAGNVWVSGDLASVAMWREPGAADGAPELAKRVWARYRALAGAGAAARLNAYDAAVTAAGTEDARAGGRGEHWYLGVLATDPGRRREGLASAVLAPVLARADASGWACCLETSTEANRRFYAGRGFTEATPAHLPGGPPIWWLRRPARGA